MLLLEIAVIEKPADHVRRDLACALQIKLVPGRELKPAIGTGQRSLQTSMQEGVGAQCRWEAVRACHPSLGDLRARSIVLRGLLQSQYVLLQFGHHVLQPAILCL
jgi:hypothetical protein